MAVSAVDSRTADDVRHKPAWCALSTTNAFGFRSLMLCDELRAVVDANAFLAHVHFESRPHERVRHAVANRVDVHRSRRAA